MLFYMKLCMARRPKPGARRRKALTKEAEEKLGEANLRYAMNECVRLMSLCPRAYAYTTYDSSRAVYLEIEQSCQAGNTSVVVVPPCNGLHLHERSSPSEVYKYYPSVTPGHCIGIVSG